MGVGPRPKPLVQPVTKTGDTGHLLPGQRIDFNSLPIPKGYVPGVGRGAAGFVTRSDIGSVRTAPGAPLAQVRRGRERGRRKRGEVALFQLAVDDGDVDVNADNLASFHVPVHATIRQ